MKTGPQRESGEWRRVELQLDTAQILLVIAMLLGLCAASFYLGRWIERDRWQQIPGSASAAGGKEKKIENSDAGAGLTFFDTLGERAAEPGRQARVSAPAPGSVPSPRADGPAGGTGEALANGSGSANSDPAPGQPGGEGVSEPARTSYHPPAAPLSQARGGSSSSASSAPTGSERDPVTHADRRPSPGSPSVAAGAGAASPASGGSFAVQVFAGDKGQAEKIAASLARKGYAARVVDGTGGPRNARVRVYGYRSRDDAQKGADHLKKEGSLKPWVVKAD